MVNGLAGIINKLYTIKHIFSTKTFEKYCNITEKLLDYIVGWKVLLVLSLIGELL